MAKYYFVSLKGLSVRIMLAAVLYGKRDLRLEDRPLPALKPDEVILKIEYAAICGTDIHLFNGSAPAKYPVILGHEYAGRVFRVGENVREFRPGDRVIGAYLSSCGKCEFCIKGKPQLCMRRKMFGINIDGCFAQYMRIPNPERTLIKIPDNVDLRDAVLIPDMFLTAAYAVERSVKLGDTVLIIGLGAIGLSTVIAAKQAGTGKIIASSRSERLLSMAKELGAEYTINYGHERLIDKVRRITGGLGVDVAIETSGKATTAKLAFEATKPGGTYVQVGIITQPVQLDFKYLTGLERSIIGVLNPASPNYMKKMLTSSMKTMNSIRKLVTHEFKLEEINEAINIAENKIGNPIKILIKI